MSHLNRFFIFKILVLITINLDISTEVAGNINGSKKVRTIYITFTTTPEDDDVPRGFKAVPASSILSSNGLLGNLANNISKKPSFDSTAQPSAPAPAPAAAVNAPSMINMFGRRSFGSNLSTQSTPAPAPAAGFGSNLSTQPTPAPAPAAGFGSNLSTQPSFGSTAQPSGGSNASSSNLKGKYTVISRNGDFKDKMKETANDLVFLYFTADWCRPCKTVKPIVKQLPPLYPDIIFFEVDSDTCSDASEKFRSVTIPLYVCVNKSQEIKRATGTKTLINFQNFINDCKTREI